MAEGNGTAGSGDQGAQPAQTMKMQVLAQYIRDMSFENVLAQKGTQSDVQPEIQVQVNLDAKKRTQDHQFEVILKFKVESKNRAGGDMLFLLELDYAGIFHIEGLPDQQLHAFLMIECPRILFPFVRRIVSDITRDGGFPPVNIDVVDFMAIYRAELARRAQQQQPVS